MIISKVEQFSLPDYSRGICNIINDELSVFGIEQKGKSLGLDLKKNRKTTLVFIDGFGWNLYSRSKNFKNINSSKISSIFPSSTDSASISLVSGLSPGTHGIVGYKAFVKSTGAIIKPLENTYASAFHGNNLLSGIGRLNQMLKIDTIFNALSRKKIKNVVITPNFTAGSSFSSLIFDGANEVIGYENIWDAFHIYRKAIENDSIKFIHFYIPHVDTIEHIHGYESKEALEAAEYIIKKIAEINENKKTNTIITADHGHKMVDDIIDLSKNKKLIRKLDIPPYGDSRAPLFRSRYDIRSELSQYSMKIFGKNEREILLGPIGKDMEDSLPDYMGAAMDSVGFTFNYKLKKKKSEKWYGEPASNHGGLSPDEMEVPVLTLP
jgi:predicted AlkP superfamily pyrophosphatase or phosphodiesterase